MLKISSICALDSWNSTLIYSGFFASKIYLTGRYFCGKNFSRNLFLHFMPKFAKSISAKQTIFPFIFQNFINKANKYGSFNTNKAHLWPIQIFYSFYLVFVTVVQPLFFCMQIKQKIGFSRVKGLFSRNSQVVLWTYSSK